MKSDTPMPPDRSGRADYDQMVRIKSIPAEEPTFLLRAKDAVAADAIRCWAALAKAAGTPHAAVEQALKQADRFDGWPTKHAPDADHLTEAQAKQLAYEHSRRNWAATIKGLPEPAATGAETQARDVLRDLVDKLLGPQAQVSEDDLRPALDALGLPLDYRPE
jgi:hypothetical protein